MDYDQILGGWEASSSSSRPQKEREWEGWKLQVEICTLFKKFMEHKWLLPRSLTASLPLKNGGWKTSLSYWVSVIFQGRTVKLIPLECERRVFFSQDAGTAPPGHETSSPNLHVP